MTVRAFPLMIVALFLTGATCISNVRERPEHHAWLGEVTNTGDHTISRTMVQAEYVNADGNVVGLREQPSCPSRLAPNESAAWEFSPHKERFMPFPPSITPRFRVAEHTVAPTNRLAVTNIRIDETTASIAVRVTNQTGVQVGSLSVCAVVRTPRGLQIPHGRPPGDLIEVSRIDPIPSELSPAESVDVVVGFQTAGSALSWLEYDVFAEGTPNCCGLVRLDEPSIDVAARAVLNSGFSDYPEVTRGLVVVGELRNTAGADLENAKMLVQVKGDPFYRFEAHTVGCAGFLPGNIDAPIQFHLPIRPGLNESSVTYEIVSVEAKRSEHDGSVRLPVRNLAVNGFDVSGDIVNDTSGWVRVPAACFLARDGSRLLGATSIPYGAYLPPNGRLHVEGNVSGIGNVTDNEIVAYGQPVPGPPPPPPPVY